MSDKLDGYEEKKILKDNEYENNNNKNEELDNLLNEALLMNSNKEDEETKNMILTIQNMKDYNKKRISQCLIIKNKLKSLTQENNSLKNKLGENNNLISIRNDQETDICLGNDINQSIIRIFPLEIVLQDFAAIFRCCNSQCSPKSSAPKTHDL